MTTHPVHSQRGFALLVAVIFMSVMLALGLALGSVAYKQQVLASSAIDSQYAFYAADSALECALYADQQLGLFAYDANLSAPPPSMTCDAIAPVSVVTVSHDATEWVTATRLSLDGGRYCADVTIYKTADNAETYLFSEGYSASCATVSGGDSTSRFSVRGLKAHY